MNDSKRQEAKNYRMMLHDQMKKRYRTRIFIDKLVSIFAIVCIIAAIIPLGSILLEVVKNGASALSLEFLIAPQGSIGSGKGGIGPAIQGTLIVVGLASFIATPVVSLRESTFRNLLEMEYFPLQ